MERSDLAAARGGPRRFQPVPIPIEALPPLDAIVVSHDPFDHLDRLAIAKLLPLGVPIVTALRAGVFEDQALAPRSVL